MYSLVYKQGFVVSILLIAHATREWFLSSMSADMSCKINKYINYMYICVCVCVCVYVCSLMYEQWFVVGILLIAHATREWFLSSMSVDMSCTRYKLHLVCVLCSLISIALHLLCKRPDVFMIPQTDQKLNLFLKTFFFYTCTDS